MIDQTFIPDNPAPYYSPKQKLLYLSACLTALAIVATASFLLGRASVRSLSVDQISPTPTTAIPTPPSDETAAWKSYSNKSHGYSIKYPNDFVIQEELVTSALHSITFLSNKYEGQKSPRQPIIRVTVYSDEGLTFGEWWKKHSTDTPLGSINNPTIYFSGVGNVGQAQNGLEWWLFSEKSNGYQRNHQIVNQNKKIYDLYFESLSGSKNLESIFRVMLSSFHFLP